MKKFLLILLAILMCLSVVACKEENQKNKDDDESESLESKTNETSENETSKLDESKKLAAEKLIAENNFDAAYELIYAEKENAWAKEMISDFVWVYQKSENDSEQTFKYEYDGKGNVIKTKQYASGELMNTTVYAYNEKNLLVKEVIDPMDVVTEYFYDESGRLIKRVCPMAQWSVVDFTYDGNVQTQWCGSEPITRKTFDENGNLLKTENYSVDKFEEFETFTYDNSGKLISSQALGSKTTYTYDEFGRLIKETKETTNGIFTTKYLDYICIYVG